MEQAEFYEKVAGRAGLSSAFQPILSLRRGEVLGYEALLRLAPGWPFAGAAEAFAAAARGGFLVELEEAALETHLGSVVGRFPRGLLFVNLSALSLLDERLRADALLSRVRSAGLEPQRVVLELTELVRVADPAAFALAMAPLRAAGFRLAVDDFGAGFTNIRMLVELGPDYVKIDSALVTGAGGHARKRVFLESLAILGPRMNCAVIGEGIETPDDLATARACGIAFGQGFGLARPGALGDFVCEPLTASPALTTSEEEPVGALSTPQDGVSPDTATGELIGRFAAHPEPVAVPVLRGGTVLGLVTRQLLFFHLGHRYGFALWNHRSVATFVAANGGGPDRVPASASLEEAAEVVRRRPSARRFDPLVIETEHGRYHGLLPVDVLLTEMTRLKVEYALQSNPLSGLPGSLVLARAAEARLAAGRPFALGWVDLDHFKSYNDRYGFSRGDEVLLLLAGLLRQHFADDAEALVTHPGGDDFAFLASPRTAEDRSTRVALAFADAVPALYDAAERSAEGIVSADRRGEVQRFGFVAVSVGVVVWRGEPGVDYRRLVETAAEVKAQAKARPGPAVIVNARSLVTAAASVDEAAPAPH